MPFRIRENLFPTFDLASEMTDQNSVDGQLGARQQQAKFDIEGSSDTRRYSTTLAGKRDVDPPLTSANERRPA